MRRNSITLVVCALVLSCIPAIAQQTSSGTRGMIRSYYSHPVGGGFYGGGFYPAFGGNGLYGSIPSTSPLDVPPRGWWASPYPSENPCQAACNPNAGYDWSTVGTLILDTIPHTAKVTLDGILAGTTDKLGPFQLPVGEHTLHIEAAGFESTDVIVKFDQPGVRSLNVELKRFVALAKPAPRQ